jgi:hypothetical protein
MKASSFLLTHALESALVLLVHELKTPAALGPVLLVHHLGFELGSLAHRPLARVVAGGLVNSRVCPLELRNKRFAAQKFRLGYEPQRAGDSGEIWATQRLRRR